MPLPRRSTSPFRTASWWGRGSRSSTPLPSIRSKRAGGGTTGRRRCSRWRVDPWWSSVTSRRRSARRISNPARRAGWANPDPSASGTLRRGQHRRRDSDTGRSEGAWEEAMGKTGRARLASPRAPLHGVRGRSAVVQGRGHLRAARARLPRQQRLRHRRLSGTDLTARLPRRPGRDRAVGPALLSVSRSRRRLRHRRLRPRQSRLRHAARRAHLHPRGTQAGSAGHHRAGLQPHLRPAPLVPACAQGPARIARARLVRMERYARSVSGCAHHLQGLRALQLDLGPCRQRLLLAPLLQPPARPQLR